MNQTSTETRAERRTRQILLSNQIEGLERQVVDLSIKDTDVYGNLLDAAGKREVALETAELRKRITSLKNALRKFS